MHELAVALVLVAGCGRIGFESSLGVDAANACPATYSALPEGCFQLSLTGATVADAEASCEVDGAHLAVIDSTAENTALTQLEGATSAWIGVANVGAGFVSITTGQPPDFARWAPGDPNGEGDCVRLLETIGDWDDEPCSNTAPFVCEVDGDAAVVTVP